MKPILLLALAGCLALPVCAQTSDKPSGSVTSEIPTLSPGMGGSGGPFTLYSLREGQIVVGPEATARADSASGAWDIGFQGTTIVLNGGTSGPGAVRAVLLDRAFEAVTAPPADSLFRTDGERECPNGGTNVICTGSGNGWYLYAGQGVIKPLEEKTLVVQVDDETFVKLRVLNYELTGEEGWRRYTVEHTRL